jgi:hypothetical protein
MVILFAILQWTQVQVVRPFDVSSLISTKQDEVVLEDVPEGTEVPYEPGIAYVYSLVK